MRTAAYKVGVASDRRRRQNVQGTFFVISGKIFPDVKNAPFRIHTEAYKVGVAPHGVCTENKKIVINQKVPHIIYS